jgi:cyclopropane-fatty-acyl-phospholipid synthase
VTLNGWKKRFMNRIDDVRQQGYSDMFIRMWEYYLDYCQAGFRENYLGTVQMLMTKEVQV